MVPLIVVRTPFPSINRLNWQSIFHGGTGQIEEDHNDQAQKRNSDQTKDHQMNLGGFPNPQNRPNRKKGDRTDVAIRTAAPFTQRELLPLLDGLDDVCCRFPLRRFDRGETSASGVSTNPSALTHSTTPLFRAAE